jgi:acyl-CoA thioester hydrolase
MSFELRIWVEPSDIDELGHVNNVTYLRWVQDVAVAHWNAAAPTEDRERLMWVVLRHEIDYRAPAFAGEELTVRTWVGTASRVRFERFTEITRIADGAVLAQARTVWCALDAVTRRPTAVSTAVREAFSA